MAAKMCWTAGLVLVALTIGQVPAGLAKPGVITEDAEVWSASERIISGWEAYPGQFPYLASLRGVTAAGVVRPCAGSVVHRNWVLTSAFCTLSRVSMVVRAGVTDLTTTPEYISETTEWWNHPGYIANRIFQNIAILKLQLTLTFSELVHPIRIQPWAEAFNDYDNEVVIASGWGSLTSSGINTPDVLNWVYLRAISNQECSGDQSTLTENFICTRGYNVTSQSTCTEDNGGPLAHVGRDGEPVLVGIASMFTGYNCGTSGNPAAFTRPGPYHSWLTNVTGIDFDEGPKPTTTEATVLPTSEATEPHTTEATVSTTTIAPKPPITEVPEPPTTEAPTTPTTEVPEPPTTEAPEPPTTEALEPPITEVSEPPTTEAPEPSTTEAPEPSTTEAPEPDSDESDENSNDSDGSGSKEESVFGNKQVKVKVKVKVNNNVKIQ